MKIVVVLTVILCSYNTNISAWKIFHLGRMHDGNVGAPVTQNKDLPPDQWFEQILDHFNPTDQRTWKQRYQTNDTFYKPTVGGPVFLMIGGEGEATAEWMVEGTWIDYAQRFGALCFQLEHRFYGKSQPLPDLSTKNLQYLSSEQALADLATFISAMNEEHKLPASTKWIVFGGSYPGSLAAWMRFKYPHLVHGAVSTSGPLLAKVDFLEYYQVVDDSLRTYSDECVNQVQEAVRQVDQLISDLDGQRQLNKKFQLCDPIDESVNNQEDVSNFYESLADNFAGVVQYNKDNRKRNIKAAKITIDTLCDILTNETIGSSVDRLAKINTILLDAYNRTCLDYKYDKMIKSLRNTSENGGARQWIYQTCTEFGFYQTSSFAPQVFGNHFPVEFYIKQCVDIYGPLFNASFLDRAVDATNTNYGALGIEVDNTVFVHGSIDPWHALGITKTQSNHAPAIFIEGTAHCADMYPKSDQDPPQLLAAREQIGEYIDSWLRK